MIEFIKEPWPWYVAGPLIGLFVPLLLIGGNKIFGVSSSLRHICAMCVPMNISYFKYDWKKEQWNLFYVLGIVIGGYLASNFLTTDPHVAISDNTVSDLKGIGVADFSSYLPADIFGWDNLMTARGFIFIALGGFLVGFGTRYGNGCTSGHAISGLSNLQFTSLVATIAFFAGGLLMTYFILPYLL